MTVDGTGSGDKNSRFKFRVGQSVRFRVHNRTLSAPPGRYTIVGYRPDEGGEPGYRIKSELERNDRIARESELSAFV